MSTLTTRKRLRNAGPPAPPPGVPHFFHIYANQLKPPQVAQAPARLRETEHPLTWLAPYWAIGTITVCTIAYILRHWSG